MAQLAKGIVGTNGVGIDLIGAVLGIAFILCGAVHPC